MVLALERTSPKKSGILAIRSNKLRCAADKKGRPQAKSMDGYPFWLMNNFVKTLSKELEYKTE